MQKLKTLVNEAIVKGMKSIKFCLDIQGFFVIDYLSRAAKRA